MSEARDLAMRHVQGFNERAWNRATELYAPDIIVVEPAGQLQGIEALVGMSKGFAGAFPDSRMEVDSVTASADRAAVEGRYTGTHSGPLTTPQGEVPPTGRKLTLPMVIIIEAAAGRITALRAYYDQMAFAVQLGLVPDTQPAA